MLKVLLALVVLLGVAPNVRAGDALVFGLPSSGSAEAVYTMWQPLLDDMSRALGRTVTPEVYDEYAGVVWAFRGGKAHLAWIGNKGAIEAVDRADVEVGAQVVNSEGVGGYYSHLIVRKDSPLEDVADVLEQAPELTFGNGDPNSTSGSLVPGYFIFASRGLEPGELFKRMVQAGHEDNFLAVAAGEVDVATNNSVDLQRLSKRYPEKHERIKIIWTSPLIPSDPIIWRQDLPDDLTEAIASFLTGYGKPAKNKPPRQLAHERAVLKKLTWSGFKRSDNSQLVPIRKLKLFKKLLLAKSDASLDDTERAKLVASIEEQLKALESSQ
ncbi:MAG: phosphate/phosphite/phosphonate ABC transporter substrate-binding protein [Oceanidesulfovibrio sp.]